MSSYNQRPRFGPNNHTPCMNCDCRFPGCHAECKAYRAWKDKYAQNMAAYNAQFDASTQMSESLKRHGICTRSRQV